MEIPIIGQPKPPEIQLEFPALFRVELLFINHQGEFSKVDFALPPGIFPNAEWLDKMLVQVYRECIKNLKLSTKDLSWRKPTPGEFVKATTMEPVNVNAKWAEPFTVKLNLEVPKVEKFTGEGTDE